MASQARRTTSAGILTAGVVASLLLIVGCATAFGELLGRAERHDGSTGLDRSITSWMVARRAEWLTTVARALSLIGSQKVLLPVVMIVAVLLVTRRRFELAGFLLVTWGGAIALYDLIKDFVGRPRPPAGLRLTGVSGSSFPSGHATQSLATFAALALVAAVLRPRLRRPAAVLAGALAAGVGWSRVYLGVHWAIDVAAGWLVAAVWVAAVYRLSGIGRREHP